VRGIEYSYHFTVRTGVTIDIVPHDYYLEITATMDAAYRPMPIVRTSTSWTWHEINKQASDAVGHAVDVAKIIADQIGDPLEPDFSQ
jgi:hypothetical protein